MWHGLRVMVRLKKYLLSSRNYEGNILLISSGSVDWWWWQAIVESVGMDKGRLRVDGIRRTWVVRVEVLRYISWGIARIWVNKYGSLVMRSLKREEIHCWLYLMSLKAFAVIQWVDFCDPHLEEPFQDDMNSKVNKYDRKYATHIK